MRESAFSNVHHFEDMVLLVIEPSKDGDHDQLKIPTKTCASH